MVVHKIKINIIHKSEDIIGEWDFVKGGVEPTDADLRSSILRELEEETGSTNYNFIKEFEEKICFEFPVHIQDAIGFIGQETTMFHLEYIGDINQLKPIDEEINKIRFIEKAKLVDVLSHVDTRNFFTKHFMPYL